MNESGNPKRRRGAPRGARPWPTRAAQVADEAIDGLKATALDANGMAAQAQAISQLAATCAEVIRAGDLLLAQQLLLRIQEHTVAQRQACTTIGGRANTLRTALVLARRGEYEA